jgi:hypothetical protein
MVNSLKKAVSTFVTLTTVLWSVGAGVLALPNAASAATLSSGDLIKASGPAVYYYAGDGKRYVFPNETTFKAWFVDFSSVKTITDAELAAIQIGGNVTLRSGTKLVKITTDPKTYAVTQGGVLHWIQSEAIAKALYGDNWAQRVVDVSDAFFVNYTVGSSVSTNVHPDGQLVMYAGDTNYYVIMGGVKRKIASDAAFAANGWNKSDAILTTIVYGNGSDVTGRESLLADVVVASGSAVSTGSLTVALASDTPAGMTVPKNASSVPLVKVNLTAGSGDVLVSGLRFHRVGVGAPSDFANVYLYGADGTRLTSGRTINSSTNLVEFNNLNLTVAAGMTVAVTVYGDFSSPGSTGGQHSFELVDAASAVVGGSSTVAGSFPVRGNVFTVGTTSASRLDVMKGSAPSNPTIGSKNVEVSNFKFAAVGTNDIQVNQVTLYQAGSITNADISNFQLYQGSTVVATAAGVSSNGHVVLKFNPPYLVGNGTTKVFSLHADVAGRASRTIRFYVEYTTDVTALDKTYSSGASVNISTGSANFDGTGSNYTEVTTQGGQLTNAFNGPATTNVAKGQLGVPLYKFSLTSPDNSLEIRKMAFSLANVTGGACKLYGSSSTAYFRSLKIKNLDTGATLMGPQELSTTGSNVSQTLTYTDSFSISAGQTLNLAFVADLANNEDTSGDFFTNGNCAYQASFVAFGPNDVRVTDTGEFLDMSKIVPNTTVTGNVLTVKSSSLNVALASTPVTGTVVKKSANVPVAGLTLAASAQSDVTVTSFVLTGQASIAGAAPTAAAFATRVTSLALFDGTTQIGLARAPDTTTGRATVSNMNLLIAKGTSKNLTVVATRASQASTTTNDWISVGVSAASDVTAQDQDSNTVSPTISALLGTGAAGQLSTSLLSLPSVRQVILKNGTLTVQADSHPVSSIVVAGKDAWVPLAQYKATAQYENMNIDRIAVLASSTAGFTSDNSDFTAVAIATGGAVKGQDVFSSGATGTKDIDLSTNVLVVPKDTSVDFQVWGKLSGIQASSTVSGATAGVTRSGHAPAVGLQSGLQTGEWNSNYASSLNIRATGAASGELVMAATGAQMGNSMILRKSVPIVTKQSLSSTTLANVDQDLIKFQIAADSAGSIAWKQVVFAVSKTSAVSLSNFRLRRGATDLDTSVYAVTAATSTGSAVDLTGATGSLAAGVAGNIVVSFKPGQEESISGSGNVYTLHATVSGAVAGQNVTVSFVREATSAVVTGYLTNGTVSTLTAASSPNVFNIDTAKSPSGVASYAGTFLWSDNSEVPHSQAIGSAGGSSDWSNDYLVTDLSQSQTLSL